MNSWLYLNRQGLDAPDKTWPVCYWRGVEEPQVATLAEAADVLRGPVCVILPMEAVSWLRSEPWPGRRKPTTRALAFAIEDQLADDLDLLHIATGAADPDSRYPLLVIHKARFGSMLALLKGLGIQVASVRVDAESLPRDQAYGAWWDGRWLLAGGSDVRLALSDDSLQALRPRLPGERHWLGADRQQETRALLSVAGRQGIDLLQGEFRQVHARWPWRALSVSLLLVFGLSWGLTQARSHYLETAAARLYEQSVKRFHNLYPEQTRIVDLSAQLKALQNSSGAERSSRMARLVELVDRVIGGSGVDVQRIEYRAGAGWTVLLVANSFTELEQLRERGRSHGLPIKLGSASKERERVQAVLTLEEQN